MQLSSLVRYKSSASATVCRDGGSLELRFTTNDDRKYCIFMEVVHDSPNDCKRYHPPMFFTESFDINSSKPEDFVGYLTWTQIKGLIDEIKIDNGQDFERCSVSHHFKLIENIVSNNGWLIN